MTAGERSAELNDSSDLTVPDLHASRAELPLTLQPVAGRGIFPNAVLEREIALGTPGIGTIFLRWIGSADCAALLRSECFTLLNPFCHLTSLCGKTCSFPEFTQHGLVQKHSEGRRLRLDQPVEIRE